MNLRKILGFDYVVTLRGKTNSHYLTDYLTNNKIYVKNINEWYVFKLLHSDTLYGVENAAGDNGRIHEISVESNCTIICGTSGSGKTYVGEQIGGAVDLDAKLAPLSQNTARDFIRKAVEIVRRYDGRILTGYFDYFLSSSIHVVPPINFKKKYYIDVPFNDLLDNIRKRDRQNRVFSDRYNMHFSPMKTREEVRKTYDYDLKFYRRLGFEILPQSKIIGRLSRGGAGDQKIHFGAIYIICVICIICLILLLIVLIFDITVDYPSLTAPKWSTVGRVAKTPDVAGIV